MKQRSLARLAASDGARALCVKTEGRQNRGAVRVVRSSKGCPAGWDRLTGADLGLEGPKGDRGPQGSTGAPGSTGPQGDQGTQGPPGDRGIQGPAAGPGPQGDPGATGPQGGTGDPGGPGLNGTSSPVLMWVDQDQDTVTIAIGNYDPAQTYAATASHGTPAAAAACTADDTDPLFGVGCITVAGLIPGQWTLASVTARASGALASTATKMNAQADPTPEAPTNVVAVGGNETLTISFTPPQTAAAYPITNYQYMFEGNPWRSASTTQSPFVVSASGNGQIRNLKLRAVNSTGPGTETDWFTGTPHEVAPTVVALGFDLDYNAGAADMRWAGENGGAAVTAVQYPLDGGNWTDANVLVSPFRLANVAVGSHAISVKVVNSAGTSPAFGPESFVMEPPTP